MRAVLAALVSLLLYFPLLSASLSFRGTKRDAPYEQVNDHPGWSHQNEDKDEPDKYFHESSFSEHYDGRFATVPLIYEDRQNHLTALLRTYISSMRDMGAETWIMHGTLLGWYWNREILPWDGDLDVMISEKSLYHLASFYNMSMHHFSLPGAPNEPRVRRNYILEVNPHYKNSSVESVNKIDARWIDTETGLFIDITTLRRNKTAQALGKQDAMMVKDKHHYYHDDIFPLRPTIFEGVPVNIPFAYAEILIEEYGEEALSDVHFLNHRFDIDRQEWRALRYAELVRYREHGAMLGSTFWGKAADSESYFPD
ncbi:mannosyltransferase [Recurvomyces mirabilis]|nr:mannosyltransferase [Recurvomyces mirabilis]